MINKHIRRLGLLISTRQINVDYIHKKADLLRSLDCARTAHQAQESAYIIAQRQKQVMQMRHLSFGFPSLQLHLKLKLSGRKLIYFPQRKKLN